MLRNVCDSCNSVIDGEPKESSYPEVVLMIDDEIELLYENLCQSCRKKLKDAITTFNNKDDAGHVAANTLKSNSNAVQPDISTPEAPRCVNQENKSLKDNTKDEKHFAEQVVKQYPITLRTENQNRSSSLNAG